MKSPNRGNHNSPPLAPPLSARPTPLSALPSSVNVSDGSTPSTSQPHQPSLRNESGINPVTPKTRSPSPFCSSPPSLPAPNGLHSRFIEPNNNVVPAVSAQRSEQQAFQKSIFSPRSVGGTRRLSRPPPRRAGIVKKKTSAKPPRAVSRGRGCGFSQAEVDSLLENLEEFLPLGKDEWEHIARLHERRYPGQDRNVDSLRRRFLVLCRKSARTGDPTTGRHCLWHPSRCSLGKKIRHAMTGRADLGDGDDIDVEDIYDTSETMERVINSGPTMMDPRSHELYENEAYNSARADPDQFEVNPSSLYRTGPSPRALARIKEVWSRNAKKQDDDSDPMTAFKLSLLQEQSRREEEHRMRLLEREDEKRRAAEDRRNLEQRLAEERAIRQEERERREEDRRRSDQMIQVLIMVMIAKNKLASQVVLPTKTNRKINVFSYLGICV